MRQPSRGEPEGAAGVQTRAPGTQAQAGAPSSNGDGSSGRAARGKDGTEGSGPSGGSSLLPAATLPEGGGAIRGIGEKFSVNPATGTASVGVPLPISPGRGDLTPQVELSYDSGNPNGPFGLGFGLSVPTISRKTERGLPRYLDEAESDVFLLSGAEDLVPTRHPGTGEIEEFERSEGDVQYVARRYRPRVEGLFARIERWKRVSGELRGDLHWRVTTRDNVTHIYGQSAGARIADPSFPSQGAKARIFTWLLEETREDKGNIVRYEYKAEDGAGVELKQPSEASRFERQGGSYVFTATAQKYLKRVRYGNNEPFPAADFLFELVFDYGDHDEQATPDEDHDWAVRQDPFSTYRPGFEVRTYRLCQRALMFHRLNAQRDPLLVRSTEFRYEPSPVVTYMVGVTQVGHLFDETEQEWQRETLPELGLDYTRAEIHDELSVLPEESLAGLEGGVDGGRKQWLDLDGEGIPGVLIDQGSAWYYKRNAGGGELRRPQVVRSMPSPASLSGGQVLEDLGGDGQLDLVQYSEPLAGYFSRTADGEFRPLRAFEEIPKVKWGDPNLRVIDLDGDGHGDLLISEQDSFIWYRSRAKQGFESAQRVSIPQDDRRGPHVVFSDPEQTIHLADMSGDGLVDIVRVRNGSVCYWPNLGFGRFGAKVTLENGPRFDDHTEFDARRVRFGDVDGSGTSDIFYLGADGVRLYLNESGNRLSDGLPIRSLPRVHNAAQVSVVDLLGTGTATLVWSSPLQSPAEKVLYVDLMGGVKPHLLTKVVNNLGAETHVTYAPSTKFYLEDRAAGIEWLTRLPFPVHVVERIEHVDGISKSRLASTYRYRHGYFDGEEREFRGFARVEQRDAEEFDTGAPEAELYQDPVRTVSWFHTGAWLEKERLELALQKEYFEEGPPKLLVPDTVLPAGLRSTQDQREAARALRGSMLRQEVYAEDGSELEKNPYVITEQNFAVRVLQSSQLWRPASVAREHHGVFFTHPREAVSVHTERHPDDPRVAHQFTLDVDDFGNVTREASVAYARVNAPHAEQGRTWATLTERSFINRPGPTNPNDPDPENHWYRVGVEYEEKTFELTTLPALETGAALLAFKSLKDALDELDPQHDLAYDEEPGDTTLERRLIAHRQQVFYSDDLSATPLALGELESLALPYETYQLALTTGQVSELASESEALTSSGTALTTALLTGDGAYVERAGGYWASSGRVVFDDEHFYLPVEAIDPFGEHFHVGYDDFDLLIESTTDPLGNQVTVENDYRVLAPRLLTDPNLNRTEVAFDALGRVVAMAVMGKDGAGEGDTIADPTVRFEYEVHRWTEDVPKPAYVHVLAREEHQDPQTRWQETYTYSDGFGRVVMEKVQAEPGEVPGMTGTIDPRWVGTGRTVFNNKGNPVKQYEPFFSATHEYEDEAEIVEHGVTPIIHYDPLDRVIRTDFPDRTISRVEFDAWHQEEWDQNDTVLESEWYAERGEPDPDLGEPSDLQERAAWLAAQHAATPTVVHLDTLGRPFLSVAHNVTGTGSSRVHERYRTRTELDIQGNTLGIIDAKQHFTDARDHLRVHEEPVPVPPPEPIRTIAQRFDVLGRRLRVDSPDAGSRLSVQDAASKPLRQWDSRGQTMRWQYNELQRQTHMYVADGTNESLVQRIVYGEALDLEPEDPPPPIPRSQERNLRGQVYQVYDCAGLMTNAAFDFKGNLLRAVRRLADEYDEDPDWSDGELETVPSEIEQEVSGLLQTEEFATERTYDALNRVVTQTSPTTGNPATDASVTRHVYNEAGLLDAVYVSVRGAPEETVVGNIEYNARGQRLSCDHAAAGVTPSHSIGYTYDPETFRLTRLLTTRASDGAKLQDLRYTYDSSGNITEKRDTANWDADLTGALGGGGGTYVYDALYRLTGATGREHAGQQPTDEDPPYGSVPHGNDLSGLREYVERLTYDEVGNILEMRHLTGPQNSQSWSRRYDYVPETNRLRATSLHSDSPGQFSATYAYDAHGSMTEMPHLLLAWDYADRLRHTERTGGGGQLAYFTYDASGQRVRKVSVHNGVFEERIYLGDFEVFRRRSIDGSGNLGALELERETLQVMDDQRRVAMAETKTVDTTNPSSEGISRWRYQLDDHLGSSAMEVDENANVISYEEYHPYGSTAFHLFSGTGVSAKRYRYTGKERDEETDLYYHGARYYAPWLGRWTAADPLGMAEPGESDLNLYAYVRGNPVAAIDPDGLQEQHPDREKVESTLRAHGVEPGEQDIAQQLFELRQQAIDAADNELAEHIEGELAKLEDGEKGGEAPSVVKHALTRRQPTAQPLHQTTERQVQEAVDEIVRPVKELSPINSTVEAVKSLGRGRTEKPFIVNGQVVTVEVTPDPAEKALALASLTLIAVPGATGATRFFPGSFSRTGAKLTQAEIEVGEFLAARGLRVEALAPSGTSRTADFLVNGIRTEVKTAGAGGGPNQFLNQVLSGKGQARSIIIDARKSGLSREQASARLERIYQSEFTKGKIDRVEVILPGGKSLFGGRR